MSVQVEQPLKLMIITGNEVGKILPLNSSVLSIGRDASSDIYIDDSRMSHSHARIVITEGNVLIEDLDSTNGTYVNSELITKTELKENDVIKLGRTFLVLTSVLDMSHIDASILHKTHVEVVSNDSMELPCQTIEIAVPLATANFDNTPSKVDLGATDIAETHHKLFVLYKASKEISTLSKVDNLLEMILGIIFDEIGYDHSVIMLRNNKTGKPEVSKTKSLDSPDRSESSFQVSETVINHVIKTRNAVLTEDAMDDQRFSSGESIVMLGVRSVMCVPLIVKENVLGVVYVDRRSKEKVFTREDLEFLTAICNQAAVSISNSQLYNEVRNSNQQLTVLNTTLVEVNKAYQDTNEKLQASYKALEEAQQRVVQSEKMSSLGRLIAGITHDMKNLLTAVYGYASLMRGCREDSKREDLIEKLLKATEVCASMVKSLLSYSRADKLTKEICDLNYLISESCELATRQFTDTPELIVELELAESLPELNLDRLKMVRVFTNIIANGMQAMEEDSGEGTMTISSSCEEDSVLIAFADTGPGISEDNMGKVFDPFFTTKKEGKGTGLGLSLCHGIITGHGGEICVKSEREESTTFSIKLPVR